MSVFVEIIKDASINGAIGLSQIVWGSSKGLVKGIATPNFIFTTFSDGIGRIYEMEDAIRSVREKTNSIFETRLIERGAETLVQIPTAFMIAPVMFQYAHSIDRLPECYIALVLTNLASFAHLYYRGENGTLPYQSNTNSNN